MTIPVNSNLNILYTSGSTAEPKGVVRTHEYIIEQSSNHIEYACVGSDDRLSLLHSICFASAEVNLYRSLLSGASLYPFDVKAEGVAQIVPWLVAEQITILHCSPSLFRQFADCLPADVRFPSLRLLHLSGAPIAATDFDQYKKHFPPSTSLAFHMGATEAPCIGSAVVNHSFSFPSKGTPAGYNRGRKKVLLVDEDGKGVEAGAVGEIAVQSRYLAKEYWRHPELTKAKFLPVPDSRGERIYMTGDLGQFRPDGLLVHLGRKDFMVKIRGYRVELGEVERALLQHSDVKEAAVVAWEREAGEPFLAAYLVLRGQAALPVDQIMAFLRQRLPDYMIPFRFSFLDSLPLINGKLNKRELPKPERIRPQMSRPYAPPESELQQSLAVIWTEVLAIDNVGIRDSFFDLGGNSLLASLVLSRLSEQWQAEISMQAFFERPTIADLAAAITEMKGAKANHVQVADLLTEIESLTDDQATRFLAAQTKSLTPSS
ncbi:MAG TPA: non-ribosomal peptide synthetase [Candidatus Binatia bacterium]